jgi:two-component system, LytTR family, sensor kinase
MSNRAHPPWIWPRIRLRPALALLGVCTLLGLWQGFTVYLASLGDGGSLSLLRPLFWEVTGILACYVFIPIPQTAILNAPRPGGNWARFLGLHLLGFALYALLAPTLFISVRYAIHPLLGWGPYHYGPFAYRLPMEWMKQLVGYGVIAGGFAFAAHLREARVQAAREAELRERLQEARLQALSAQLDPHFLFNALNTISSVMYEDLARTDHLLASLGRMLRDGLESDGPWTLARELAHLEAFLAFATARFGDRIQVRTTVAEGLGAIPVPRYCLQRLVENALKHNRDRIGHALSIDVSTGMEGGALALEVRDDGVGFADPAGALEGSGLGLRNLRDGLALQYGPGATLEVANPPEGGARVRLRLETRLG